MHIKVFSSKPHDVTFLSKANAAPDHLIDYVEAGLSVTTVELARGAEAVCVFVNDRLDQEVVTALSALGVRLIALRCAGFNNVDLHAAKATGIAVSHVPAYSPYAVAEHTIALILTLNRKTHRAWARVREGNFELTGLMGFDLHGKTVGVIGTGQIGTVICRILLGFGCRVLAHDPYPNTDCVGLGVQYLELSTLLSQCDIVTLQCPLTPQTHHLISDAAIAQMKRGAMLINTSRGAVIDTRAVVRGLKSGHIGALGIDVYEEEADLFFEDLSDQIIPDDVFARLLTFPNVLVTGHQGFFTVEALQAISKVTIANVSAFERDGIPLHAVPTPV